MPGESLKSKLEGNHLDLSLSSISSVPVKELAVLPKATSIDLSCNLLTLLPPDFCTLTHLVKIDLSKNQLTELPEDFGFLQKLQHLDLYQNQLRVLPISFCRLNSLKWLDIKDNQLEDEDLLTAAGECLSDAQCRNCAKHVVAYMKKVQSDHERERQRKLKEERELEAVRKAQEQHEIQRRRAEKKAEKEQRRLRLAKEAELRSADISERDELPVDGTISDARAAVDYNQHERKGLSCFQLILTLIFLIIAVLCGAYVYCSSHPDVKSCDAGMKIVHDAVVAANNSFQNLQDKVKPYFSQ